MKYRTGDLSSTVPQEATPIAEANLAPSFWSSFLRCPIDTWDSR